LKKSPRAAEAGERRTAGYFFMAGKKKFSGKAGATQLPTAPPDGDASRFRRGASASSKTLLLSLGAGAAQVARAGRRDGN